MSVLYLIVLSMGLFISEVSSKSDGAPTSVCASMSPSHGLTKQSTASPYNIALSSAALQNGVVTVTISGTSSEPFQGFMLQAHNNAGNIIAGTFTLTAGDTAVKTMDCTGGTANSVTHTGSTTKTSVSVAWAMPGGLDLTAGLYFRATVAETASLYWEDVRSNTIDTNNIQSTTATTAGNTMSTTETATGDKTTTSKSAAVYEGGIALILTIVSALILM